MNLNKNNIVLQCSKLKKTYVLNEGQKKRIEVLQDITFNLYENEFLTILGPNGCGKTTIFKIILGIEKADEGEINFLLSGNRNNLSIGYVPQQILLLPWYSVWENLLIPFKVRGLKINKEVKKLLENLLELWGLEKYLDFYPHQLSGGITQIVSVIRGLITTEQLLLMDEPFSSVDQPTKIELTEYVKSQFEQYETNRTYMENLSKLQEALGIVKKQTKKKVSVLYITHDIEEAISLSDRIIVLSNKPAKIKEMIVLQFETNDPIERRKSEKFSKYFSEIWDLYVERKR